MKAIDSADIRPRDLQSPQSSPQSLAPDALFALRHIHGGQLAPDGHGIAFGISETNGREGFSIWVDNGGGDGVRRIPFDGQATLPRWSPQGEAIAFVGDGRLCVSSTEEFSDCRVLGPAHVVVVGPPIWTPDGGAIIAEAETASPPCSGSPISDYDYRAEGVGLLGKPSRRLARFDLKGECFEWLCGHEGPQRIAHKGYVTEPLLPGMILSNEPGYYKAGAFGLRIENLMLVERRAVAHAPTPMLGFETLTLAPIDRDLIVVEMLTPEDIRWLDDYHKQVAARIGPLVDETVRKWIGQKRRPLATANHG